MTTIEPYIHIDVQPDGSVLYQFDGLEKQGNIKDAPDLVEYKKRELFKARVESIPQEIFAGNDLLSCTISELKEKCDELWRTAPAPETLTLAAHLQDTIRLVQASWTDTIFARNQIRGHKGRLRILIDLYNEMWRRLLQRSDWQRPDWLEWRQQFMPIPTIDGIQHGLSDQLRGNSTYEPVPAGHVIVLKNRDISSDVYLPSQNLLRHSVPRPVEADVEQIHHFQQLLEEYHKAHSKLIDLLKDRGFYDLKLQSSEPDAPNPLGKWAMSVGDNYEDLRGEETGKYWNPANVWELFSIDFQEIETHTAKMLSLKGGGRVSQRKHLLVCDDLQRFGIEQDYSDLRFLATALKAAIAELQPNAEQPVPF